MIKKPTESAYEITKFCEGLYLHAYQCPAKVWTIGWGHTKGVIAGMTITKEQAENFLINDSLDAIKGLNKATLGISLTQNQYNALFDFVFNKGIGNFLNSKLYRTIKINPNDSIIPSLFSAWIYGGDGSHNGKDDDGDGLIDEVGEKLKLAGLVTRAKMQSDLYIKA